MNIKKTLTVAALSAFAVAGAYAQEATKDDVSIADSIVSTKTREQVKAELAEALKQGGRQAVFAGEATYFPADRSAQPGRTRAEVREEAIKAMQERRRSNVVDEYNIGG
ncbi:DUF4148 domain-containing protein [Caldimonas thermodepolymerans]|jgi:hypothetical protein|uniref:Uncharacterized protein DUF4148 n=1 Tax=Caldimonas thermodepolymerans TaxID=215580 RepID=A0A2S5T3Y7_9BURK|nr:DUF4148 domain-containing protein [Caldimonas thermodepolymerans]PPE69672.1 hypothetical protein C1702_10775 [Caldimonas thermodepolymerans]QPC31918.1 DUF4148 domain-containing protein [Caldimonas thermodepolymerans]RDI01563.1 uncharacterized protein DUF4148 [Caldimonas thermodepolymerans]TCP04989.1 uncharacterized protein DUF4148 [Caldimonas thermodepolymerans]UZG44706.1 DUF4148 domain-containing protein [Caldimonas thermodepolymerans]